MKNVSMRRVGGHEKSRTRVLPLRTWNRRLHFYLGLYFLLFIWLFSISGLLLNHSDWAFATFWEGREESSYERVLARPTATGNLEIARELMAGLRIDGEINGMERDAAEDRIAFQVARPGQILNVEADLASGAATVSQIDLNGWGVFQALHTFSGVSMTDPARERDWVLTRVWSFAMDAVALGLIVLVLSGIYLWYRLPKKRIGGLVSLGLGITTCGFFLFGFARLL